MSLASYPETLNLTDQVRRQFAEIYENTSYIMAGTLGRTAVMEGSPEYWYRRPRQLRDIDIYDPTGNTPEQQAEAVHENPLPIDSVGSRWLTIAGDSARLGPPQYPDTSVEVPSYYFEPITASLLDVPVRTFRPEILMGLNMAVPYDRKRQRVAIQKFQTWVTERPNFSPSLLDPFADLADQIRRNHPEYIRNLRARDAASSMPRPVYTAARLAWRGYKAYRSRT